MICFIALAVFAVMGIFSATHRRLAKEAFDCVFRKVTLRRCDTGLDTRLRAQITGLFMRASPRAGRFVYRHFQVFSWIFTIIFIWSIVATAIGGYNWWIHGNCNGPNEDGFCVFDPLGQNTGQSSLDEECVDTEIANALLTIEDVNRGAFYQLSEGSNDVVVIGCYACPFTRKAYPTIRRLLDRDDVAFWYTHFPVHQGAEHLVAHVTCVDQQGLLTEYNDLLFATDPALFDTDEEAIALAGTIGVDEDELRICIDQVRPEEEHILDAIEETGVYGTPLVFINGEPVVGPKPYRVYKRLLE